MTQLKKTLMAAAAALAVMAAPAMAQNTGCYLGLQAGANFGSSELSVGGTSIIDGISSTGAVGGLRGGCDYQMAGTNFVLGLLADVNWKNEKASFLGGALEAKSDFDWSLGGRAGLAFGNALPYVSAGYTQSELTFGGLIPDMDISGYWVGGGIDYKLGGGFVSGLDVRYVMHDKETILGGLDIEKTDLRAMLHISYKIGVGSVEADHHPMK
jgi:opacity protein-like surface antigen